jgi:YD repeat-containing protein
MRRLYAPPVVPRRCSSLFYNNLSSAARSYTNAYLYYGNSNYSSRYIYNRLLTSTLNSVTPNVTLVSNVYDGGALSSTLSVPREWDWVNYGASFTYRGNVTQANTPGKTVVTAYDYTGTVVSQNDNNGHSVNVATSTATNYTLPDTLSPNGSSTLETQATYTTGYFPASVAAPGQTIYDPVNSPSGTAAYTGYDSYGRVSYTLAPSQVAGQAAGAQTYYTYGYASDGWTITATTAGHFTTTFLDGLGRTISVKTGTGGTVLSQVNTGYAPCACSPLGKMYAKSQPFTPPNSSPVTYYSYDALGRTINVLLADGASHTTYAYQGNFTTVTDPAGNWKQYVTDAFGNLVTVIEPDPSQNPVVGPPAPTTYPVTSAPAGTLLTSYTYDQFNHLTLVSMPRVTGYGLVTQKRTFVYTPKTYSTLTLPAMWLTSATNPESGTTSYTYNADGTLASKTDANGNTETYTYDAYQRLTGIPDRQQTFTYDTCPANDSFCTNAPGYLVEAVFATGVGSNQLGFQYDYTYTPAGKVAAKSLTVESANHLNASSVPANGTLTVNYGYDSQGALVSQQYPVSQTWASGTSNTFTYILDALERPTQMTDSNNKTWASGATYNAANQPLYDGTATRTYNNLMQTTSIVGSGLNMTYNYSATMNNGQIASSADGISGETVAYYYDALKRLSGAGNNTTWSAGYTYDGYGNLFGITAIGPPSINLTVQVDGNNVPTNRIVATGVAYDNNGNLTAGFGGLTFSYDKGNRMTAVGGGASEAYAYDAQNLRVYSRNGSGAETIYFYGADGKKLATYTYSIITYSGNPEIQLTQQSANVYFLGKLISAEGNAVQVDRLGSVRSGGPGGLGHQA